MKKLLAIILVLFVFITSCRYVEDGKDTAFKEFKPSTLLKKYEYFKDASAQLDAKVATLGIYETTFIEYKTDYGKDRLKWPKDVREEYSIKNSEYMGIKASYNTLAADYNANMVKFNYAFCNRGTLPQGAITPLPREYKPYFDK